MPTFELRNKRARLIVAEFPADDLVHASQISAEHLGLTIAELLSKIPRDYDLVETSASAQAAADLPRRRLFTDRPPGRTVH